MSSAAVKDQIMKDATGLSDDEHELTAEASKEQLKQVKDALADGEEGDDHASENADDGKKKKESEPVKIPTPDDFERHAKWKPEPFPEGENFATIWSEIRARKAEEAEQEIEAVLEKYVSSGLWPTGKLQVTCRAARTLRKAAAVAKQAELDRNQASKASAAERAEEKKKQLEALKAALSLAMTGQLMHADNRSKPMEQRIAEGLDASKAVFKEWAPKINSWKSTARSKAIVVAGECGISSADADAILLEDGQSPPDGGSPSAKKRKASDADSSVDGEEDEVCEDHSLVTPQKPDGMDAAPSPSAPPPTQASKHKAAKKTKSSPTAVEAAGQA